MYFVDTTCIVWMKPEEVAGVDECPRRLWGHFEILKHPVPSHQLLDEEFCLTTSSTSPPPPRWQCLPSHEAWQAALRELSMMSLEFLRVTSSNTQQQNVFHLWTLEGMGGITGVDFHSTFITHMRVIRHEDEKLQLDPGTNKHLRHHSVKSTSLMIFRTAFRGHKLPKPIIKV